MADLFNTYELTRFAGLISCVMGIPLPDSYAPGIDWAADILIERLGGKADRAVIYHADAVGMYIWQKYTHLFAPVYAHTSLTIPFISTVESVTPVAHASMYTGLSPDGHGIRTYTRPKLTCDTLYDRLIAEGKRPAILATKDSTFHHIFTGRNMDYFEADNAVDAGERAIALIEADKYDFLSIHTFDYDTAAHHFAPESKQALNAISLEAEIFANIARAMKANMANHRALIAYSPDHGQHLTPGGTGSHGTKLMEDMNIVHMFGAI